ncbi:MAG: hypothetical protein QOH42_486 [Blastocatellia bacterium]|jgi:hypothetical protein|nr:hypothetical protein [Blastocatellia bacterium]
MQKPLKSRALRNHKYNLPVKKKAAGVSSGGLFVFNDSSLAGISEPC